MIFADSIVLRFVGWVAERLGFNLDFWEDGIVDSLNEREVSEQLQYGRD